MGMVIEDYVSFEVAKLLKDKGFNEPCNAYWFHMIDAEPIFNGDMPRQVYNNKSDTIEIICCPTLQMAMKWLREMHKIAYNIFVFADDGDSGLLEYIYEIQEIDNELMHVNGSLDTDNSRYEFYEEACEAAIKYCLENLI